MKLLYKAMLNTGPTTTDSIPRMLEEADASSTVDMIIHDVYGPRFHTRKQDGRWLVTPAFPLEEEEEEVSRCPACGDPIDYCQGHGKIGDRAGRNILMAHDEGEHTGCHRDGCETAAHLDFILAVHDALTKTNGWCYHPKFQDPQCAKVAAMLKGHG